MVCHSPKAATINSDLDNLDEFLISGEPKSAAANKRQQYHDATKFKTSKSGQRAAKDQGNRDNALRSITMGPVSFEVDHELPREGELMGKNRAKITQVTLATNYPSSSRA